MKQEITRSERWSRNFLLERVKEYYNAFYSLQNDWLYEEKFYEKKTDVPDTKIEIYKRHRHNSTLKFENGLELITVFFSEDATFLPSVDYYEIYFERISEGDCHGNDLFAFEGYSFGNGESGKNHVHRDLDGIKWQLSKEEMPYKDTKRDAEIYKNCISLLKDVMEWTIFGMNSYPAEFKEGVTTLPLNHFKICQRLFWNGYQGGTNTREKLKQMLIDEDEKIEIDPNIFELEEYEI